MKTMPCKCTARAPVMSDSVITISIDFCRWTSGRLSAVLCEDDSECCRTEIAALALCDMQVRRARSFHDSFLKQFIFQSTYQPSYFKFRLLETSRVGQQLQCRLQELECEWTWRQPVWLKFKIYGNPLCRFPDRRALTASGRTHIRWERKWHSLPASTPWVRGHPARQVELPKKSSRRTKSLTTLFSLQVTRAPLALQMCLPRRQMV